MTDFYVSTTGSDNNPGRLDYPFKTIQKAANIVHAGDTVYIRGGTYNENVSINGKSGASGAWITFSAYNNEHVIIDTTGVSTTWIGIIRFYENSNYIRITGLELKSTKGHGVFAYVTAPISNIRVDHCAIHDCQSSSIYIGTNGGTVTNIEFDHNTVYDVNNGLSYGMTYSPQEAISFSNVQGFEIHHNNLSMYGKEGIDTKSGSSNGSVHHNLINTNLDPPAFQWDYGHLGIYCDGYTRNNHDISIYDNYISGMGGNGIVLGAEQSTGSLTNISVYNNIVYITKNPQLVGMRGIVIAYNQICTNLSVYSNTVYMGSDCNPPMSISPDKDHLVDLVIVNNIFVTPSYYALAVYNISYADYPSCMRLANNLFQSNGWNGVTVSIWKDTDYNVFGENSVYGNPLFVSTGNDFHLQSGSPVRDKGIVVPWNYDYDGVLRPQETNFCIGAYEYKTKTGKMADDSKLFTIKVGT